MRRGLFQVAAAALAVGLATAPTVAHAEDPGLDKRQWWFDSWSVQQVVWPRTKGAGVTVAVIDSGVNASLPDLRDVVLPGTDVGGSSDGRRDLDSSNGGHGTAMASLIASQGKGTGFMGIAPQAKILPIRDRDNTDESESRAIRYAVDHGAKVINISMGGPGEAWEGLCPPHVFAAIAYAAKKDVVVVASAGNSGDILNSPEYPGSCPGVVAVGAIDHLARPWAKTQRQDYVTVAAPGVGMRSVRRDGRIYVNVAGTSDSSALTSGVFALLRSEFPEMSARRVVQVVTNTTVDVGPEGKDKLSGYGAVSIRRALSQKVATDAPNPVYERLDKAVAKKKDAKKDDKDASTAPEAAEDQDSGTSPLLYVGIGVAVLVVVGVIGFLLMRRRRPSAPGGPPPGGLPPGGPSFGGPSFGSPPGAQQVPYQQPGPQQPGPQQPGPHQPGGYPAGAPPMGAGQPPQYQPPPPQYQPPPPPRSE